MNSTSSFKSFSFPSSTNPREDSRLTIERIERAVQRFLAFAAAEIRESRDQKLGEQK